MYEYRVKTLRVVDGDTSELDVDLGLNIHRIEMIRLYGVDTPELNSSDPVIREKAKLSKSYVESVLLGTGPESAVEVKVQTLKPYSTDKYGRWLGVVQYRVAGSSEWRNLNEELVAKGLASAYFGGAR